MLKLIRLPDSSPRANITTTRPGNLPQVRYFQLLALVTAAFVAFTVPLDAQDSGPVLRVDGGQDQIVHIRAKTRHTTVIVLAPNGKRAGFCSRRFRILAPDRSRESRVPQAHCRGRHYQRRAGLRVRAHLLIPCHRAKQGPAASCRPHRPRGRRPIRESRPLNMNRLL